MRDRRETLFSDTYDRLVECCENMTFPLETVCSAAGTEYECLRREQLIGLCAKIAAEFGREVGST
jgi:hypothetical protein